MSAESLPLDGFPSIIHTHATTWHDGGAALLLPDGRIYALAAERVGDRYKHSWNSRLADEYLRTVFSEDLGGTIVQDKAVYGNEKDGLETTDHHLYHAASTYYGSGFQEAGVLVVDGQGPENGCRASTSIWHGKNNALDSLEMPYLTEGLFAPQSIGHFYTAVGAMAGMKALHEEGKTMGLAAYGQPSPYLDFLRQYAYSQDDGNYYIDPNFVYATLGNTLGPSEFGWEAQPKEIQKIWYDFMVLRGYPIRRKHEEVTKDDANIAYAGQVILEELMLGLAKRTQDLTATKKICLAGGVALNSVANGKIATSGLFEDVYVFPAAGDDGQAIGKLFVDIKRQGLDVNVQANTAYYGPEYSGETIKQAIQEAEGIDSIELAPQTLSREVAHLIMKGAVIGWFQGGSELGPRALGHRSILADPRIPSMRHHINTRVKHRELYRPFAPVVTEEAAHLYFDIDRPSPFMLFVANVLPEKRELLPAITHVDGTARVQTIRRDQDERYYDLVKTFGDLTGTPVLLNTSFNNNGEPIVETPQDAIRAFTDMALDYLVLGNYLIRKLP